MTTSPEPIRPHHEKDRPLILARQIETALAGSFGGQLLELTLPLAEVVEELRYLADDLDGSPAESTPESIAQDIAQAIRRSGQEIVATEDLRPDHRTGGWWFDVEARDSCAFTVIVEAAR